MGGQEHEGRKDRERSDRPPRTESEERKRRERRKERDERHKREKEKIRTGGRTKKPQGLDIIDKLDVTGIYGQGREYKPFICRHSSILTSAQYSTTMDHSMPATPTET